MKPVGNHFQPCASKMFRPRLLNDLSEQWHCEPHPPASLAMHVPASGPCSGAPRSHRALATQLNHLWLLLLPLWALPQACLGSVVTGMYVSHWREPRKKAVLGSIGKGLFVANISSGPCCMQIHSPLWGKTRINDVNAKKRGWASYPQHCLN